MERPAWVSSSASVAPTGPRPTIATSTVLSLTDIPLLRPHHGVEPGAVCRVGNADAAAGSIQPHVPHALALFLRHVEPLVAPQARAVMGLERLPGVGIDDLRAPAVFDKKVRRRVRIE